MVDSRNLNQNQDKVKVKQKNRRGLRRNKTTKFKTNLSFYGVNAAGILSKLPSFNNVLESLKPTVFFIEETKLKKQGNIKTEQTKNYQIFELNRKEKHGGGLAIGALDGVNPVWIREGSDEVEILVVEISVNHLKIRCICGYGPQEGDSIDRKEKFWAKLEYEVQDACINEACILIQMDGNLWGGPELVRDDPNSCNGNGKLFKQFLINNPQLTVVNNLELCEGSITRSRKTVKKYEKSILDFFIVCEKLKQYVTKMIIDEEKQYTLSRYSKSGVKVDTDHNPLIMYLDIQFCAKKPGRVEYFNFKNKECQQMFFQETNFTLEFENCFDGDEGVKAKGKTWFKKLNNCFYKSFKKIRFTGKTKETNLTKLFDKRRELVQKMKKCDEDGKEEVEEELNAVDEEIGELVAEENKDKVVENFKEFASADGLLNIHGMWKVKRKICPKNRESLPLAKKDFDGKLITSQNKLKSIYLETFIHRLRSRPMKDELNWLRELKEELCSERIKLSKLTKTKSWNLADLEKVLRSLKNNKCRDPHGVINEIFKPGVIGEKLKISLLTLLNNVKSEISIPEFMEWVNIVSIYKGKGEKADLKNDRGIFTVNLVRTILMKLIYQDKYPVVDESMSDSQIGARKKKNIRNHIFVLNGIINEAIQTKGKAIDVLIYDYRQCFDALWLDECINDLYDAGVKDDELALIYEANKVNRVAVKTPFGLTSRETVNKIVLQGEVFGPLQCSVTVDTFGKECLSEDKLLYNYKDVKVPALAMVDDLACISNSGVDSVEMNAFINTKTNIKKLQFGSDKCHQLHIGNKEHIQPDLFIDNWEVTKISETNTGVSNLTDTNSGEIRVEVAEKDTYLGDIITNDGKHTKNILARKSKGMGVVDQISTILEEICFGPYQLEVALSLRNAMLLNGILTNSEAWYGLTVQDISNLEQVDEMLLRKILEAPFSTPKCMLYLETGVKPIRYTIKMRRLMFLQYLLQEDPNSMISQFFHAQDRNPSKNDWAITARQNLEELSLNLTYDDIRKLSKLQFHAKLSKAMSKLAFEYLIKEKNKAGEGGKTSHIQFSELNIQKYLLPHETSVKMSKFIFHARSRMLNVKNNFKNRKYPDMFCPVCCDPESTDSQQHILVCSDLDEADLVSTGSSFCYDYLFSNDVKKQVAVATILEKRFAKRRTLLRET